MMLIIYNENDKNGMLTMITVTGYELHRRVRQKCGKPFCRRLRHQVHCRLAKHCFNAIYTSEDHVPGIRYIVTRSACKALNWPIKNSNKKNCFNAISTSEDPTTLLRASMVSQEKIVRYRMLIKLIMRNFYYTPFNLYKIKDIEFCDVMLSIQAMMMCGKTNICFLNLGCICPRDVQSYI